ncbi:MAG: ABC transporter substrate-binding protein [Pseudomonadota bacterium]
MRALSLFIFPLVIFTALAIPSRAATVIDSQGEHQFDAVPARVVALSWSQVEQLISLDIEPVGVADPKGYNAWVVEPVLPEGVVDVGQRHQPNLERIADLDPDVIVVSDDQIDFKRKLERIAPVVHFDSFSEDHDNVAFSRQSYLALAALFEREALAQSRLAAMDARINELAESVKAHFGGDLPHATVVRFLDRKRVAIYGDNGMTTHVMDAFGLPSEYPVGASTWGLAIKKVPELGRIEKGYLLHILPFEQQERLFATKLWQSMPVAQSDRVVTLPSVWTYGGALSVGRIAELIAEAMLAVDPAAVK